MNTSESRPLCHCGRVPRLVRSEGKVWQVCRHRALGFSTKYRAENRPCSFRLEDLSGDVPPEPRYRAELLRRVEWPDHCDVPGPPGDPMARYRSIYDQPQNASGSGGGEGSRALPDGAGQVPMQQFVLVEQRAETAERRAERLRRRVDELEHELADLKLSYGEQSKEFADLKRKYDEVVDDNVIYRTNNRAVRRKLESTERKLEGTRKQLKSVRSAGLILSRVHNTSLAMRPPSALPGESSDLTSSSQAR